MLKTCNGCRKLFNANNGPSMRYGACPSCCQQDQEYYQQVHNYLRDHPGSSPPEIHLGTGVPSDVIMRLMKDGKVQSFQPEEKGLGTCTTCGNTLVVAGGGGKCRNCTGNLAEKLQAARTLSKAPSTPAMARSKRPNRYGLGSF